MPIPSPPHPLIVSSGQSQRAALLCHRHPDPEGPVCPRPNVGPAPWLGEWNPLLIMNSENYLKLKCKSKLDAHNSKDCVTSIYSFFCKDHHHMC